MSTITSQELTYAKCVADTLPGAIKLLKKNGISTINQVQIAWRRMPKTFLECYRVHRWGHPGGLEAIMHESRYGVQV